jgi:hypothetical protein
MQLAHFHPCGGDAPFFGRKVNFAPFRCAEFRRPRENQWSKAQGTAQGEISGVAVYGSQQRPDLLRVGDGSPVLFAPGLQGSAQVRRDIVLGPACSDCKAHDLAHKLHKPVRGFQVSLFLNRAHNGQDVLRFQFADHNAAESGEKVGVQPEDDMSSVLGRELFGLALVPLHRKVFEGMGLFRNPAGDNGLFVRSGVNALGKQSLGVLTALTGVFQ